MKKKNFIDLAISIFALTAIYALFSQNEDKSHIMSPSQFSTEAFETDRGWGYRIRQDTTTVIEQRSVLHIAGNQGFQTKQQALVTAQLVKHKLDHGIFPPVLSRQELDSLGIRNQ
ncbi:DUF4907 domain-containing protein [Dyadobacter chenwenxiniae]|uniref:DUF4907 domain-containing protein n=1 Tax=Dyadobacter chenwenxiniae TaxID=2906456 RepID=A0A9X1PFM5_9BACT|nr:DUF4907 domain-containing protein [Dyadobacter chenwenxiniae]MCF0060457.1 DUF4907 domain-containing protein [Dyadobacter chenwenxiniae]UON86189.1 DUF4907 domain-containing protein [Dyadobacter chenwenxiniae]